jgi:hypothetical protein
VVMCEPTLFFITTHHHKTTFFIFPLVSPLLVWYSVVSKADYVNKCHRMLVYCDLRIAILYFSEVIKNLEEQRSSKVCCSNEINEK